MIKFHPNIPPSTINYLWTKVNFLEPLIAPMLDFVRPSPWVSKPGLFSYLHSCLHAVNLRFTSGATPAFLTIRSVNCTSVYTAGLLSGHPSCQQQRAGSGDFGPPRQQMSMHYIGKFKGMHPPPTLCMFGGRIKVQQTGLFVANQDGDFWKGLPNEPRSLRIYVLDF